MNLVFLERLVWWPVNSVAFISFLFCIRVVGFSGVCFGGGLCLTWRCLQVNCLRLRVFDLGIGCGVRLLQCGLVSGLFRFEFGFRWFVDLWVANCLLVCGSSCYWGASLITIIVGLLHVCF